MCALASARWARDESNSLFGPIVGPRVEIVSILRIPHTATPAFPALDATCFPFGYFFFAGLFACSQNGAVPLFVKHSFALFPGLHQPSSVDDGRWTAVARGDRQWTRCRQAFAGAIGIGNVSQLPQAWCRVASDVVGPGRPDPSCWILLCSPARFATRKPIAWRKAKKSDEQAKNPGILPARQMTRVHNQKGLRSADGEVGRPQRPLGSYCAPSRRRPDQRKGKRRATSAHALLERTWAHLGTLRAEGESTSESSTRCRHSTKSNLDSLVPMLSTHRRGNPSLQGLDGSERAETTQRNGTRAVRR